LTIVLHYLTSLLTVVEKWENLYFYFFRFRQKTSSESTPKFLWYF